MQENADKSEPEWGEMSIRYNVPSHADVEAFGSTAGYTLHAAGLTVYFDRIREEGREGAESYMFIKHDSEVAFVASGDYDVSPLAAMKRAEQHPGEYVRFADPK